MKVYGLNHICSSTIIRWLRNCFLCTLAFTTIEGSYAIDLSMRTRLAKISKSVVDLTSDSELLLNKDFLVIYHHPDVNAVLQVLLDQRVSEQDKIIGVLSLQNTQLRQYLSFLKQVGEMRKQNRVSARVFETALFPGYHWSAKLEENYTNGGVRTVLKDFEASGLLDSSQKTRVANVLNGKAKKQVDEFVKDQEVLERQKQWGR